VQLSGIPESTRPNAGAAPKVTLAANRSPLFQGSLGAFLSLLDERISKTALPPPALRTLPTPQAHVAAGSWSAKPVELKSLPTIQLSDKKAEATIQVTIAPPPAALCVNTQAHFLPASSSVASPNPIHSELVYENVPAGQPSNPLIPAVPQSAAPSNNLVFALRLTPPVTTVATPPEIHIPAVLPDPVLAAKSQSASEPQILPAPSNKAQLFDVQLAAPTASAPKPIQQPPDAEASLIFVVKDTPKNPSSLRTETAQDQEVTPRAAQQPPAIDPVVVSAKALPDALREAPPDALLPSANTPRPAPRTSVVSGVNLKDSPTNSTNNPRLRIPFVDRVIPPMMPREQKPDQQLDNGQSEQKQPTVRSTDKSGKSSSSSEDLAVAPRINPLGLEPQAVQAAPAAGPRPEAAAENVRQTTKTTLEPEINPASQPQPARQVSLKLTGPNAAKVDVELTEKAGKVQVAVRTADHELTKSLQSDLGELVGKLESKGFKTEAWIPALGQHAQTAAPARSNFGENESRQPGSGAGQQQPGRQGHSGSNQQQRRQWMASFKETMSMEQTQVRNQ
jgi:hypothetical protein